MAALMSCLFLDSERIVKKVEGVAQHVAEQQAEGYVTDNDELEPAEHWHRCLKEVRSEWEVVKQENESLRPSYRKPENEEDDVKHLEDLFFKLGDMWRARDYLLNQMDSEHGSEECRQGILKPMALFMLAVVRSEELESEALRMTRVVRAKFGDGAGLPKSLEGLLGGQRSVAWWLRETEVVEVGYHGDYF